MSEAISSTATVRRGSMTWRRSTNAAVCSFCAGTPDRLLVMAPDGAVGICEVCVSS